VPDGGRARLVDELSGDDAEGRFALDRRTRGDLDLDEVCAGIDRTVCPPGSQYLYWATATPATGAAAAEPLIELADAMANDPDARVAVQVTLEGFSDELDWRLPGLLWRELPSPGLPLWLLVGWACLLPATALLAVFIPALWLAAIGVLFVNLAADLYYQGKYLGSVARLGSLGRMLRAGRRLAELSGDGLDHFAADVRTQLDGTRGLAQGVFWLSLRDPLDLADYVRNVFLLNAVAFFGLRNRIDALRPQLQRLYLLIGRIDTAQSVAALRAEWPVWCTPRLTDGGRQLRVENLCHPLVDNAVGNSLTLAEQSLLVTGSNMSGKSTFLKALAVNSVLAQGLGIACASAFETPYLRVVSSVDSLDSVVAGKSYYLDELESVLRLVRAAGEATPTHLFVIDELFRGTNPTERVAAASEVLLHLAAGDIVIAATHDLEICDAVGAGFRLVHLAETIDEDGLSFDYRLREGVSNTRNAIALLGHVGFPPQLVDRARQRAGTLEAARANMRQRTGQD